MAGHRGDLIYIYENEAWAETRGLIDTAQRKFEIS